MRMTKLMSGEQIPTIGLFTEQLSYEVILVALSNGYKMLEIEMIQEDGSNQTRIKKAIVDSKVKREDLFIIQNIPSVEKKKVHSEVTKALEFFDLDYFDMILFPYTINRFHKDTYKELLILQENKLLRNIGVKNLNLNEFHDLVRKTIPLPYALYIDFHECVHSTNLLHFCKLNDIVLMTNIFTDNACGSVHPDFEFLTLAQRHIKTVGQIMVRQSLQSNFVTFIKTNCEDRVVSYANVFTFNLTDAEMKMLQLKRIKHWNNR